MDEMNQNTTKFNSQNLKCQNLKKKKKNATKLEF